MNFQKSEHFSRSCRKSCLPEKLQVPDYKSLALASENCQYVNDNRKKKRKTVKTLDHLEILKNKANIKYEHSEQTVG